MTELHITKDSEITVASLHCYIAIASDLGLKPGEWPAIIGTDLGNKLPFLRDTLNESYAVYVQSFGCIGLTIYND